MSISLIYLCFTLFTIVTASTTTKLSYSMNYVIYYLKILASCVIQVRKWCSHSFFNSFIYNQIKALTTFLRPLYICIYIYIYIYFFFFFFLNGLKKLTFKKKKFVEALTLLVNLMSCAL